MTKDSLLSKQQKITPLFEKTVALFFDHHLSSRVAKKNGQTNRFD
ncbi:MAG: hypothetical protein AAGK47_06470 [Bacteroidota bacterium]